MYVCMYVCMMYDVCMYVCMYDVCMYDVCMMYVCMYVCNWFMIRFMHSLHVYTFLAHATHHECHRGGG